MRTDIRHRIAGGLVAAADHRQHRFAGMQQAAGLAHFQAAVEQVHIAEEAKHKRRGRMVVDGLGRAVLLDVAAVHQHYLVGHFQRLFLVVRDEHAGHMQFIVQAAQPAAQFLAHLGVQRAERFVEQQHARLNGQRAGQRNALALPARELRRIAVGQPVELHQFQQRLHLLADLRFRGPLGARLHAQAEGHVLEHAHMLEQRVVLEHEAHLALAHMLVRGIAPGQHDLSRVGALQAGDDAQQRGLAATGRPQQRGQLAFVEIE
ncbi:hypothetical protein D3C81_1305570 [compost metagenome]